MIIQYQKKILWCVQKKDKNRIPSLALSQLFGALTLCNGF